MKGPEDIIEWTQIIIRRASTQDYDDTGLFTDDYDDEVFATLNRGVGRKHHPNSKQITQIYSRNKYKL